MRRPRNADLTASCGNGTDAAASLAAERPSGRARVPRMELDAFARLPALVFWGSDEKGTRPRKISPSKA